jgi:2-keto-4-pentenoate hydratase
MPTFSELVDHISQPGVDGDPARDIVRLAPNITRQEAQQVQLAVKRKRAAAGDRIIGHQASFTTSGVRKMFPDAPMPMVGTLLASLSRNDGDEIELDAEETFIESEIALILKRDLEGPDLTEREVLSAIDCFLPSIEIAPLRPGVRERAYSYEHLIAVQKSAGGYVFFGSRQTAARGIDIVLEGCLVSLDGEPRAAAMGFEAMGSPLKVVSAMARTLHGIGEKLLAGQVIMTGSLPAPPVATRANRVARADFAQLGSVTARFA